MPKISIVMPTYNQYRYIHDSIKSILNQTFDDFELIIINDGSTDKTLDRISTYTDKRIKIFSKKNGGTGSALNCGFKLATGVYETWFASDNFLQPTALEEMNNILDNNKEYDFVYTNIEIRTMNQKGTEIKKVNNLKEYLSQEWDFNTLINKHYNLGIVWLWRRWLREAAGEYQLEPCEDYDMALRMAQAGGKFYFLDKNLGWFRKHIASVSYKVKQDKTEDGADRIPKWIQQKAKERMHECK